MLSMQAAEARADLSCGDRAEQLRQLVTPTAVGTSRYGSAPAQLQLHHELHRLLKV